MAAVFGAKLPHSTAIVPTGVTQMPNIERVLAYRDRLDKLVEFIEEYYIPDLVVAAKAFPQYWDIGKGYGNYLSYGVFRMEEATGENTGKFLPAGVLIDGKWDKLNTAKVSEFVANSRFSSASGLHPFDGETVASPQKGYSWLKGPRYQDSVMEVGPLARTMVAYYSPAGHPVKKELDDTLASLSVPVEKMNSVIGRHLARGLEALRVARQAYKWLNEVELDKPAAKDFDLPKSGKGFGLTEAPRGALGHWLVIDNYKIKNYQCVVPTTWNCSPRDDQGRPGVVEKALEDTVVADAAQPIELGRIVRSFDPCIACAVH